MMNYRIRERPVKDSILALGSGQKIIRVLIVDDSSLTRGILQEGLNRDPGIRVVGTAPDPYAARDKIIDLRPDVLTLDVEMPRMDGVEFLRRLMPQFPLPVLMVSALTQKGKQVTLDALEAGAIDFVSKPSGNKANNLESMMTELRAKVKIAAQANVSHWKNRALRMPSQRSSPITATLPESTYKVIAVGASTGGTEAIRTIIRKLPSTTPGVTIVQHMPEGFTRMFAERLNGQCALHVKEAASGDRILQGHVLIAPGNQHMRIIRSGDHYEVRCEPGNKVCGHCPSVDVLTQSVANQVGANALGIILTGMGRDGAEGMAAMRRAGARTLGQDEATSVVFGMPHEAHKRGGVEQLLPIAAIAPKIIRILNASG